MRIFVEKEDKTIEKSFAGKGSELLKELGISPENVLIVKNGEVVSEDEKLDPDDEIKLLSVVSGG